MATVYVIWNRQEQRFVGGSTPQLFSASAMADTHVTRQPRHDGGKKPANGGSIVFDVVSVTI